MKTEKDDIYGNELADYIEAEEQQLAETRLHPVDAIRGTDKATAAASKAAPAAPSLEAAS